MELWSVKQAGSSRPVPASSSGITIHLRTLLEMEMVRFARAAYGVSCRVPDRKR